MSWTARRKERARSDCKKPESVELVVKSWVLIHEILTRKGMGYEDHGIK
jgi:hypothetical protein